MSLKRTRYLRIVKDDIRKDLGLSVMKNIVYLLDGNPA